MPKKFKVGDEVEGEGPLTSRGGKVQKVDGEHVQITAAGNTFWKNANDLRKTKKK